MIELNLFVKYCFDMYQYFLQFMGQWQDVIQVFDEVVGNKFGFIIVEYCCLKVLMDGVKIVGQFVVVFGLILVVVILMIDRLEKCGFFEWQCDGVDWCKVFVVMIKFVSDMLV